MTEAHSARSRCLVAPPLAGPITGGTVYNRELCAAASLLGEPVDVFPLDAPDSAARLSRARLLWIDSLYLDSVAELKRGVSCPVGLFIHYLPSFVSLGRAARREELTQTERRALGEADAFLVTSEFMREALEPLVAPQQSIMVMPPGSHARLAPAGSAQRAGGPCALLIGNVAPGKGVLPLLEALGEWLRPSDHFQLSIIGSMDIDLEYAGRCRRRVLDSAELARTVKFLGAQSAEQTQLALRRADLLLSASCMESYGMALAEARVTGVAILACAGGNVAEHVSSASGGQLLSDPLQLALACLQLVRKPAELSVRVELARAQACKPVSWRSTARRFLDQCTLLEK